MTTSLYKMAGLLSNFIILMLVFTLYSCGPEQIFGETRKMDHTVWSYSDTVSFRIDITDTTGLYDVLFYLNHTENYAFQNLYFTVDIEYPDHVETLDTLNINIADKMGRQMANCRRGTCKLYTRLMKNIRFQQTGIHRFNFNQFTRIDSLSGIKEVGLLIEKTKF